MAKKKAAGSADRRYEVYFATNRNPNRKADPDDFGRI